MLPNLIDKKLNISWSVELEDGTIIFDSADTEISAWLILKKHLSHSKKRIKGLNLFHTSNASSNTTFSGARLPQNKKGYCFLRKAMAMFGGPSVDLCGIGYLEDDGENLTILWYNSGMSLVERETRNKNKCEMGLILNQ